MPRIMPTIPPRKVSIEASNKNCDNIAPVLAPIDFLIPISLVLSVTDTSMMFMTPIPPTTREITDTSKRNVDA